MKNKFLQPAFWLFILILGFRTYFALTHISFSQDQARDLFLTEQRILSKDYLVSYGPKTSIGDFTVFPFYYQLMTFSHLVVDHPLTMYLVVTFLESFTPVVLYLLLKMIVSKRVAWASSFIYGLSYLSITYGTSAWSPNLVPLFSMITLYSWMSYLLRDKKNFLTLGVLSLAFALHLHFQTLILVPFAIIIFVISVARSVSNLKYWLWGIFLAFLTFLPYIYGEINSEWSNSINIFQYYTQEHSLYFDRVSKIDYIATFFPAFFERFLFGLNIPGLVLGRLIMLVGFIQFYILIKKSRKKGWLAIYFLFLLVLLRLFKGDKLDYYLMIFFPLPVIFLALFFEQVKQVALVFIVAIVFFLGFQYARPQYNDLALTLHNAQQLASHLDPNEPIHLIFHDLDLANVYLYALSLYSDLNLDIRSKKIVDVCTRPSQCVAATTAQCRYHQITTYSALLKWENKVEETKPTTEHLITQKNFAVSLTTLDTEIKIFPNELSGVEERKDLILSDINSDYTP